MAPHWGPRKRARTIGRPGLPRLVGFPGDLEQVTVGIGEIPGVNAKRPHMRWCCQRAASGFDLREQPVDLRLRPGGDTQAELGRAGRPGRQAGVLGQVGPLVQREQQAIVEGEDGDRPIGAGELVVELPPNYALGRPAHAVTVKGDRPVEVVHRESDEEDLRSHCRSSREESGDRLAGNWSLPAAADKRRGAVYLACQVSPWVATAHRTRVYGQLPGHRPAAWRWTGWSYAVMGASQSMWYR